MDQRASDVEEDLNNILNTRQALADKIRLLEQRIEDSLRETTAATLGMIDLTKSKAIELIEGTAHHLHPFIQAGRRPWTMVGSAVAIGFLAGWMEQRWRRSGVYPYYPSKAGGAGVMPSHGRGHARAGVYPFYSIHQDRLSSDRTPSRWEQDENDHRTLGQVSRALTQLSFLSFLWGDLRSELASERKRLQEASLVAGRSFLHDVVQIAGRMLIEQIDHPGRTTRTRYVKAPNE